MEFGGIEGAIFVQYGRVDYQSCRDENLIGCPTYAPQGRLYAIFDDSVPCREFRIRPLDYDAAELFLVSYGQCTRCQHPAGKLLKESFLKLCQCSLTGFQI